MDALVCHATEVQCLFVETEGIEPSSKQGTRKLSTRLANRLILLSAPGRWQPNADPSPFVSPHGTGIPHDYLLMNDTLFPSPQGAGDDGRVLVARPAWGPGIKLILPGKIKQRVQSDFRHLIFERSYLRASAQRSTCLRSNSACCQNRSSPCAD